MAYNQVINGIDYSQYANWQAVKGPNGENWYAVPGGGGFVYDPYLSGLTSKVQLHKDPTNALKAQKDVLDAQKAASSPAAQLIPVAGTVTGLWAADHFLNNGAAAPVKDVATNVLNNTGQTVANTAGESVANNTASTLSPQAQAFANQATINQANGAAANVPYPVGTAENGGTVLSDGTVQAASDGFGGYATAPANGSIGQIGGGLATAKGAYDTAQGFQHGGEGLRTGTTELGSGIGTLVGGPVGAAVGAATGNVIGYGLQGTGWKNDAALLFSTGGLATPLIIARHLGFNPIHQTTRQVAQEHTQDLLKSAGDDKAAKAFVESYRAQYDKAPTDKTKQFDGKYATFDDYQKAGLDATDLVGVYGNLQLGKDYAHLTPEQRVAFTQSQIDANNYKSKKGEVDFKDKKAAQDAFQAFLKGNASPSTNATTSTATTTQPVVTTTTQNQQPGKAGSRLNQFVQSRM